MTKKPSRSKAGQPADPVPRVLDLVYDAMWYLKYPVETSEDAEYRQVLISELERIIDDWNKNEDMNVLKDNLGLPRGRGARRKALTANKEIEIAFKVSWIIDECKSDSEAYSRVAERENLEVGTVRLYYKAWKDKLHTDAILEV